jgi:hypothetical protein
MSEVRLRDAVAWDVDCFRGCRAKGLIGDSIGRRLGGELVSVLSFISQTLQRSVWFPNSIAGEHGIHGVVQARDTGRSGGIMRMTL